MAAAQGQLSHTNCLRRREKQLRQVKVSAEDVALIAAEFEVDKKHAELRLREHDGDVKAALESFL